MGKLWSGRFDKPMDRTVEEFTASLPFDRRLYRYDIAGSVAHCRMLAKQGIVNADDGEAIIAGLQKIRDEIERGEFDFDVGHEDIHMAVESRLRELIGEAAGMLHTARSRNDQVALDFRMYVRDAAVLAMRELAGMQMALLELAKRAGDAIMPGYTHLQCGQPILVAHHLLAYVEMLERDCQRFGQCHASADVSPLGAGALAGVPYPIAPEQVALELGFGAVFRNSVDAVSDRDFALEYLSAASMTMMHLSRIAEELVIWSTREFGFVEIDDAFCTGSSIMPQKKNPDVAELVRGKAGRVFGHLQSLLVVMKGLPLAYNKDMQEDKECLFDTSDTLLGSLGAMSALLGATKIDDQAALRAVERSFALATDLADYLVAKGTPFRQAHEVVGRLVKWCLQSRKLLSELSLADYQQFSNLYQQDVLTMSIGSSAASRVSPGGTAPVRVAEALAAAYARLSLVEERVRELTAKLDA